MDGTITVHGTLTGALSVVQSLSGTLSGGGTLHGNITLGEGVYAPTYDGAYTVTPKAYVEQVLETDGKLMADDVTVFKIPYYETSNIFDGLTVFIAEDTSG